jgi:hypothetical protein
MDELDGGELGCCVGLRRDVQDLRESFGYAAQKTDNGSRRQEGCCQGGWGVRARVAAKRGEEEEEETKSVIVGVVERGSEVASSGPKLECRSLVRSGCG